MSERSSATSLTGELFGDLQIRDYLQIAKRQKWWIILTTLAVCIPTVVVGLRLPNLYKSETVILVDPQKVPDSYVPSTVSSSIVERLTTIKQQVLSPTRLKRLIDTLNLYPHLRARRSEQQIIAEIQKSIVVDVVSPGGAQLSAFRIAFSGKNPREVAQVTNQLASMFIEENLKVREQQSYGTAEFLDKELQETKKQLEQKEGELQAIKSRYIMDLPESKQYHLEMMTNLRNQLQAIEDRVNRAKQEKVYLQSLMVSVAPTIDLDTGLEGVQAPPYQSQIQKLESRLSELRARYGSNYPDIRRVQKEIDQLKAKATAEEDKVPVRVEAEPATATGRTRRNPVLESQIQKLNQEIAEQSKLTPTLQEQINFHLSKLERIPVFEQQIIVQMRDYDTLRAHYTRLLDKKLSAEMSSALESRQKGERFVVLDPAMVPEKPFAPNRLMISLAGLLGGLMAGVGLAAIVEITDESVRDEREAARITGKPVLVGIPRILTKRQRRQNRLRALGAVAATVICSAAFGLLISRVSDQIF